jgi:hypothetical protein
MRSVLRRTLSAFALSFGAFAVGVGSAAADPFEPNEKITDPTTPLKSGVRYVGWIENGGDDDYYMVRGSGQVSIRAEVLSDACPDGYPALNVSLRPYDTAFEGDSTTVQGGQNDTVSLVLEAGRDYRLLLNTAFDSGSGCSSVRVDYAFTMTGNAQPAPPKPVRLMRRPALGHYYCDTSTVLHQAFKFRLARGGVWYDRTFPDRVKKGRWTFRKDKGITTLFTAKGNLMYRFTYWRDTKGKFLAQHPRTTNPQICRR